MSDSSTILTTDGIPLEERVIAKIKIKWYYYLLVYIWGLIFFVVGALFKVLPHFILGLVVTVITTIVLCSTRKQAELLINNSNRTIILISRSLCKCCCSEQKIIDMNKIAKMNSYEEHQVHRSRKGSWVEHIKHCILYYRDGSNENISSFFEDLTNEYFQKCNNLLRKYIVMDYRNPKMDLTIEMTGIGGYPDSTPGAVYNPNIMPNQINNPVLQPYYTPGIPLNYNPNIPPSNYNPNIIPNDNPDIQQNYNLGMAKNIPENFSGNGNIYANTKNVNTPENNMDCQVPQDSNNVIDAK